MFFYVPSESVLTGGREEHIRNKYFHKKWVKKGLRVLHIPSMARNHVHEIRLLKYLNPTNPDHRNKTIPSSEKFRSILKREISQCTISAAGDDRQGIGMEVRGGGTTIWVGGEWARLDGDNIITSGATEEGMMNELLKQMGVMHHRRDEMTSAAEHGISSLRGIQTQEQQRIPEKCSTTTTTAVKKRSYAELSNSETFVTSSASITSDHSGTITPTSYPHPILYIPNPNSRSSKTYSGNDNSSSIIDLGDITSNSIASQESVDQSITSDEEVVEQDQDIPETKLEWSRRMKRYQQEEWQYLGLNLITTPPAFPPSIGVKVPQSHGMAPTPPDSSKITTSQFGNAEFSSKGTPQNNLQPNTETNPPQQPPIRPTTGSPIMQTPSKGMLPAGETGRGRARHDFAPGGRRLNKSAKLSKERFEEWLDGLIPGSPTSRPSTITTNSDNGARDRSRDGKVFDLDDVAEERKGVPVVGVVGSEVCRGCGMVWDGGIYGRGGESDLSPRRGEGIRDWGVQTDISGCLIVL
jgi:hypothetical protein